MLLRLAAGQPLPQYCVCFQYQQVNKDINSVDKIGITVKTLNTDWNFWLREKGLARCISLSYSSAQRTDIYHSVFQLSRQSCNKQPRVGCGSKTVQSRKRSKQFTMYYNTFSVTNDLQIKKWRLLLKTCSVSEQLIQGSPSDHVEGSLSWSQWPLVAHNKPETQRVRGRGGYSSIKLFSVFSSPLWLP